MSDLYWLSAFENLGPFGLGCLVGFIAFGVGQLVAQVVHELTGGGL